MIARKQEIKPLALAWTTCAAILVAVEFGLWLVPARALLSYNQQAYAFDTSLDYRTVNRVSALLDPPDIAIIGNSRPLRIIDAPLLKEQLAAHGMSIGDVRNYSCAGARARTVYAFVRRLRSAGKLPRVLVWGVSPLDFLRGPRQTVNENLTAFLSIDNLLGDDLQLGWRSRMALFPLTVYACAERCVRTLTLRSLVRIPSGPSGPAIGGTGAFHVKEQADHAAGQDRCFVVADEGENNVHWYLWNDELRQETALNLDEQKLGEEAVRLAHAGGAQVILVEAPVSPLLRRTYPDSIYDEFLETGKAIAERNGARFISVQELGVTMDDRDYKDFGHANWRGVEKFTIALAKSLAASEHETWARNTPP